MVNNQNQGNVPAPQGRRRNRRRGGAGFRDLKPQFLTGYVVQTANNTYKETAIPLPQMNQLGNGKVWVVEILKVFLSWETPQTIIATAIWQQVHLCTKTKTTTSGLSDKDCIMMDEDSAYGQAAITPGVTVFASRTKQFDLTDGAGNGVLVAVPNLYLGVQCANRTSVLSAQCKVLYRLVEINATEAMGIMTSA